jgi:hypothetical protein
VNGTTALPGFGVIQAALRRTTERLVREVVAPTDTTPAWSDFDWSVAKAACAMQGISVLLANRLRWHAPAFRQFLEAQRVHGEARHAAAGTLLARLDSVLGERSVAAVALKGSALRAFGLYAVGERPMGDVDLLIKPRDVAACADALAGLGYEPLYSARRHDVFAPRALRPVPDDAIGEHRDHPLKVEVHTRISEALPVRNVEITQFVWPAMRYAGLNPYPSTAALFRHVVLHAAGGLRANAARFIQVHDIGQLARRLNAADWAELLENARGREPAWWMFPPLSLAAHYLPGSVPDDILTNCAALCPPWLRSRYERRSIHDVSWCNLRIPAFPGMEWSRSPIDAVRFARSRLFPDRVARAELAQTAVSQPRLMQVPWYGISHAQRIARWVFTRPPRVQTISAIAAALRADSAA